MFTVNDPGSTAWPASDLVIVSHTDLPEEGDLTPSIGPDLLPTRDMGCLKLQTAMLHRQKALLCQLRIPVARDNSRLTMAGA